MTSNKLLEDPRIDPRIESVFGAMLAPVPEVAPYPAGLNDCISGLKWVAQHAGELGVDAGRIIVAGESGGGSLTLATGMRLLREGTVGPIQGLYALCPYIAGIWPLEQNPSSIENEGIGFYRLLLREGAPASSRQVMGIIHGTEIMVTVCPEVSREAARSIAGFCKGWGSKSSPFQVMGEPLHLSALSIPPRGGSPDERPQFAHPAG